MSVTIFDQYISEISKTDFEFYCEYKLSIRTSKSQQPFRLYDYQKYLSRLLDKKKNLIVVTPRQMGLSTLSNARAFWEIQTKTNIRVVFVHSNYQQIDSFVNKVNYWVDNHHYLDTSCSKGGIVLRQKGHIKCTTTGSEIICVTAPSISTRLRGLSIDLLIFEDFAWKGFDDNTFQSLLSQVNFTGGRILLYSTPAPSLYSSNTELFKKMFFDAKNGKNNFYAYRIPWWAKPEHNLELLDGLIDKFSVTQWQQEILGEFD